MRKLAVNLILVLFIMGVAVVSYADEKKAGDMPHHKPAYSQGCEGGQHHMFMFKKLGLNDQQKAAIRAIHFRTMKEMVQKKADIKVAKIELREILTKDPVDMAAAEAAVKKIENLRAEKTMMHIKAMEEIKSNLNADQKKQFTEMMMHWMMMHKMMKRGGGECGCQEHHHKGGMMKKEGMHQDKK